MQKYNLGIDLELLKNYNVVGSVLSHFYILYFDSTAYDFNHVIPQSVCIGNDIYVESRSWISLLKDLINKLFSLGLASIDDFFRYKTRTTNEIIFNLIPIDKKTIRIRDDIYMIRKLSCDEYVQLFKDISSDFGDTRKAFFIAKIPTINEHEDVKDYIRSRVIDIYYSYMVEEKCVSLRLINQNVNDIYIINECLEKEKFKYNDLFAGGFMGKIIEKSLQKLLHAIFKHIGDDVFMCTAKLLLLDLVEFYNYLACNSSLINNGTIESIIIS